MFRTLSPKQQPLNSSEKTAPRRKEWVRLYTSLQQREQAVWTSKIRFQVKEFNILCTGRCKPLGSLNSFLLTHLSYLGPILFPCSPCFLHSPWTSAVTMGELAAFDGSQFWAYGTTDWFKIGKGVQQGYILSLCLFNYMQSASCKMWAGWIINWNQNCWEKYQ